MRLVIFISGVVIAIAMVVAVADDRPVSDTYYGLIYDFEVAQFCGLVNQRVHDAFWAKRKMAKSQSEHSIEALRQIRIKAMAAADIEYANRGLGGYKPWCNTEGRAGIARIINP